jgi:hypothetical protein
MNEKKFNSFIEYAFALLVEVNYLTITRAFLIEILNLIT